MGLLTSARIVLSVVWVSVATLAISSQASAQRTLPDEVVTEPTPSPASHQRIAEYVEAAMSDFQSGQPDRFRRGRQDLQRPLMNVAISPGFRNAYGEAVQPRLERIASGEYGEEASVVAVQLLGELATERAIAALERFQNEDRSVMRYAAAYGMAKALRAVQSTSPAIGPDRVGWIVDRLKSGLAREKDPVVGYMYVRGLMTASAREQPPAFAPIRTRALMSLASVCGERLRGLEAREEDIALLPALIGAGAFLRDVLAEDVFSRSLPREVVAECAGTGGDMLAYVNRQIRAGDRGAFPPIAAGDPEAAQNVKRQRRLNAVALTALGEAIVMFAKDAMQAGTPGPAPNLAQHLEAAQPAGDALFLREVRSVFVMLTQTPFSFPDQRFLN